MLFLQDERIQPKVKFLDSEDSIGPYLTLNPSQAALFWMPDVFIDQAKALRNPTFYTKPASLRVYNDSTIRYSSRQVVDNMAMTTIIDTHLMIRTNYDVACNMDFHKYPVDEQYCEVKYESFGLTSKQVRLFINTTSATTLLKLGLT